MACGHQGDAYQLIDAPVAGIEAGTQRFRPRQVDLGEREIGLTEPLGRKADRNIERPFVTGLRDIADGPAEPCQAAIVCFLRNPLIGELEESVQCSRRARS